jgi:peptide/nickel transport system permease protein
MERGLRWLGGAILLAAALVVVGGATLAPHEMGEQFRDHLYAPPMSVRVVDADGWHRPFVHPLLLEDRVTRRFRVDTTRRVPLVWWSGGKLVRMEGAGPLLLLGADGLGRDVFTRLVLGARASLGVAGVAVIGALVIGILVGATAGYTGGATDEVLMRLAEFVLVLPAIYVVLALRAALPLVLPSAAVFGLMAGLLALVGWPPVARGVRAIVASERRRDYAVAAASIGVRPVRLMLRHLLPATSGFLAVQVTLLLPAFILAEATLSFVGLGFAEPTASWGTMLREAGNVRAIAEFPWLLSPAAAIVLVVLGLNLLSQTGRFAAFKASSTPV